MLTISVVIPTKNRLTLLKETVLSIKDQTFRDWECIVVDDGSDDGTHEFMTTEVARDPRFQYLRRSGHKAGANVCRNQGAAASRAELLIFLDSDDVLATTCLEERVKWMTHNPDLDFVVCHADAFLEIPGDLKRPASCHKIGSDLDRFLYFDLPWLITGPTWRRDAFFRLGGFAENIPSWQDIELHIRAIAAGLVYLNLPISDYHVRWQNDPAKTSLQQRRSEHHLLCGEKIVDSLEQLLIERKLTTWSRLRAIANLRFFIAENWATQQRWTDAIRVWKSVRKSQAYSTFLYFGGKASLFLIYLKLANRFPFNRCIHYWKGLMRLRHEPRLTS